MFWFFPWTTFLFALINFGSMPSDPCFLCPTFPVLLPPTCVLWGPFSVILLRTLAPSAIFILQPLRSWYNFKKIKYLHCSPTGISQAEKVPGKNGHLISFPFSPFPPCPQTIQLELRLHLLALKSSIAHPCQKFLFNKRDYMTKCNFRKWQVRYDHTRMIQQIPSFIWWLSLFSSFWISSWDSLFQNTKTVIVTMRSTISTTKSEQGWQWL